MKTQKDLTNKKIILASQSPRRHSLIKKLNIDFDVLLPTYKEKLDSDIYNDKKIASLSLNKALSVLDTLNTNKTDNKSLKNTCPYPLKSLQLQLWLSRTNGLSILNFHYDMKKAWFAVDQATNHASLF